MQLEHAAVNRRVVGSSPTGGAIKSVNVLFADFFMSEIIWYIAL